MTMSLSVGRMRTSCLRPSLSINRCTPLASSNAPTQASPPNPHFSVHYLVQSCGFSTDQAIKSSQLISHLNSPDKPDAVLGFLREIGVNESDIRTAVLRDSRLLCSHVEKNLRPNVAKLQDLGFSIEYISGIISRSPHLFRFNFVRKVDFWMGVLESPENLSEVLKLRDSAFICSNLEKVLMPNLYFLQEECGLSPKQIVRLMKSAPRLISFNPDIFNKVVERAEKLGVARTSGAFIYALSMVSYLKQSAIDARLDNLKKIGLSQQQASYLISKEPLLLGMPEEVMRRKMEYLINEAGCDKLHVIRNPNLLKCSLENRLMPRNVVRKLMMSKGLPVANLKFASFNQLSDEKFVQKFVLPYEHAIPGLHRAYADASPKKIGGVE
ncbi:transcription termination factor MTERF15, mitochondrial-like [Carex rostrata]